MIMKKTLSFTIALLVCVAAWGQKYKDCYAFDLKGDVRICVTTHPDGHRDTLRFTEEGALADERKEVVRTEDGLPKTIITKQEDDGMAENPLGLLALLFYGNSNDTTEYVFMRETLFLKRYGSEASQYRYANGDVVGVHHVSSGKNDLLGIYMAEEEGMDAEGYEIDLAKGTVSFDLHYQVLGKDDKGNWTKRKVIDGRDKSEAYEYREITYWEEGLTATATYDSSITGLINNPLGIGTYKGWGCSWDKFVPLARKFYGACEESYGDMHFSEPAALSLCGQPVNYIDLESGQKYDHEPGEYHIMGTRYAVSLHTPRAYKIDQKLAWKKDKLEESDCQWDKESVIAYFGQVLHALRDAGWDLREKKPRLYECRKGGRTIQLNYSYIRNKNVDCYVVYLYISVVRDDSGLWVVVDE